MYRRTVFSAVVVACCALVLAGDLPQYTADGRLLFPANYREWIYLSSGVGMSYNPTAGVETDPSFDNVFVSPAAYHAFQQNGTWPDGTMLVLEGRKSRSHGSINKGGHFQTDLDGIEVEVKDVKRFPGKWAFFSFGDSTGPGMMLPAKATCYSCHAKNGAVD